MEHNAMRRMSRASIAISGLTLAACTRATQPQGGHDGGMMGGMNGYGWMGGYGGPWALIFLVVIVGLVAWFIAQGRKKR